MPEQGWDPQRAIKRYISTLPGSRFWTPARVTGAALIVNPSAAPTAALATLPAAGGVQPRTLQHLPVPKAETPHDEASAARYGARWYREHAADARRDAVDQLKAENDRNNAERERALAERDYTKQAESMDTARETLDQTRKAMDEYREFLRKGK